MAKAINPFGADVKMIVADTSEGARFQLRVTVEDRAWYFDPDDARAVFLGLARFYSRPAPKAPKPTRAQVAALYRGPKRRASKA